MLAPPWTSTGGILEAPGGYGLPMRRRLEERWARARRFLTAVTGTEPGPVAIALHMVAMLAVRIVERFPHLAGKRPVRNEQALAAAVAEGRGVIVVHTHLFGPALDSITLAARGYPGKAVAVAFPEHASGRMGRLTAALERFGGGLAVRGDGSMFDEVAAGLRRGEIFHMSVDVPGSTPARFLGCDGKVAGGVGTLALLTGATVVPVAPSRTGIAVQVHDPVAPAGEPPAMTQRLCDWASAEILSRPYAWEDNDLGLHAIGRPVES
jgi:lauroyl/myristoyl acyltransferase